MSEHDDKRCKVAYCKCGIRVSKVSILPDGDTDKELLKEYTKMAKAGHKIDYISVGQMKEIFGGCWEGDCWKEKNKTNEHANPSTT